MRRAATALPLAIRTLNWLAKKLRNVAREVGVERFLSSKERDSLWMSLIQALALHQSSSPLIFQTFDGRRCDRVLTAFCSFSPDLLEESLLFGSTFILDVGARNLLMEAVGAGENF